MSKSNEKLVWPPTHIFHLNNTAPILSGDIYEYHTRRDLQGRTQFLRDIFLMLVKARMKQYGYNWYEEMPQSKYPEHHLSPEQRVVDLANEAIWYMNHFEEGLRIEAEEQNENAYHHHKDDVEDDEYWDGVKVPL